MTAAIPEGMRELEVTSPCLEFETAMIGALTPEQSHKQLDRISRSKTLPEWKGARNEAEAIPQEFGNDRRNTRVFRQEQLGIVGGLPH